MNATLPAALVAQAEARPDAVALRHKRLGRWVEITWAQYADRVARVAAGLQALGVQGGERVVIQADNRPEWVIADLAIQSIGAITVGVSPDASADALGAVLGNCGACAMVAEDEEQLDKALAVRADAPQLRRIVVIDDRGLRGLQDEQVSLWAALEETAPAGLQALVAGLDPEHPAIAVYAEDNQGATLDHNALVSAGRGFGSAFEAAPGDSVLSCLPLSEVSERLFSVAIALDAGYVVHFGERAGSLGEDLREVQPTLLHAIAPIWEAMDAGVRTRMEGASALKRRIHGACVRRGTKVAAARSAGSSSPTLRVQALACHALVFGALREKLGLSRTRIAVCSGEALSAQAREGLTAMGTTLVEVDALDATGLLAFGAPT